MKTPESVRNLHNQSGIIHIVPLLLFIIAVGLISFLLISSTLPFKDTIFSGLFPKKASLASDTSLRGLTNQMMKTSKQLGKARGKEKADLTNTLVDLAKKRQQLTISEAKNNPTNFLDNTLPPEVITQLPAQVQSLVEKKVTLQGNFTSMAFDGTDGKTHLMKQAIGGREVTFANEMIDMPEPGTQVKAVAFAASDTQAAVIPPFSDLQFAQQTGRVKTKTTGDQNLAVMLINFSDNPLRTDNLGNAITIDKLKDIFFNYPNSVNKYYQENSYGNLSFTADFFDWKTIPMPEGDCTSVANVTEWANQAAAANNLKPKSYDHFIIVTPVIAGCSNTGFATTGGNLAFVAGWIYPSAFAHEIGHNLVWQHASSLHCAKETLAIDDYANCTTEEYGDTSDVMGSVVPSLSKNYPHFNAPHKLAAKWLDSTQIAIANKSGTYPIAPLEEVSSAKKVIRVPKKNTKEFYYISYREPIGFDTSLSPFYIQGSWDSTYGVSIHLWDNKPITHPKLLYQPELRTDPENMPLLTTLGKGGSFDDQFNGIKITQLSDNHSLTGAIVKIEFKTPPCIQANPTVTSTTADDTIAPGESTDYNVTVTDNDNSSCNSSQFNLSDTVPTGINASFASQFINLAPGASANATLRVTASNTVADGIYDIVDKATDAALPTYNNSSKSVVKVVSSILPSPTPTPTPTATPTTTPTSSPTPTPTSIPAVGFWRFDENSGASTSDSSGNGNNGTLANGPSWVVGKFGSALSFPGNGTGAKVTIPDSSNLQFGTGDFSVSAWVFPRKTFYTVNNQGTIISKNYTGFEISFWQGILSAYITGTHNVGSGNYQFTLNQWYFVTLTRSGKTENMYVNGNLVGTSTYSDIPNVSNPGTPIFIGSRSGDRELDLTFDGIIDHVRLYNYAQTPEQIARDMSTPNP